MVTPIQQINPKAATTFSSYHFIYAMKMGLPRSLISQTMGFQIVANNRADVQLYILVLSPVLIK